MLDKIAPWAFVGAFALFVMFLTFAFPRSPQQPLDAAVEWNAKARAMAEQHASEERAKWRPTSDEWNEMARIYTNCMKTDKPAKRCAELAGFPYGMIPSITE